MRATPIAGRPTSSFPSSWSRLCFVSLLLVFSPGSWSAHGKSVELLDSLTQQQIQEARNILQTMKHEDRGPYLRIRWFCADGTVHPPAGTPCRTRGGGVQHAELNPGAGRLAELHIHVGTILQSLTLEQFLDTDRDHHRLKSYCLEDFLFGVDDGWALRKARYYRGARQIEDEQRTGQRFLEGILANPKWVQKHFLLAFQLVGAVPHETGVGQQSTQKIRNLATELAALDHQFQTLRIKIHSFPSSEDLATVERLLTQHQTPGPIHEKLLLLSQEMVAQYDPAQRLAGLAFYQQRFPALAGELDALQSNIREGRSIMPQAGRLVVKLRRLVEENAAGRDNLLRLNLSRLLQEQAFSSTSAPIPGSNSSRRQRLNSLEGYYDLATGAGFLSWREREALAAELQRLAGQESLPILEFKKALTYLARSLDWSLASVRQTFGPVQHRYSQVEARAAGFPDALVRGSILLPLSRELDALARDADRLLGQSHHILGQQVSQGVAGLNPGVALRRLEIVESPSPDQVWDPTTIYVIPETLPELGPVAGVLSLDMGNPLSHVQLLARSLGIPNAAISSTLLRQLRPFHANRVFYAVSPMGIVQLKDPSKLSAAERELVSGGREARSERILLDTSRVRLNVDRPIPLAELKAADGGVVVGPKAANLGQLAHYFPNRVSAGLALPFGMYYRHINRTYRSQRPLLEEIQEAFRRSSEMRRTGHSEEEIDRFMVPRLAEFREAITGLDWIPQLRRQVVEAIRDTLGQDLTGGVFVRSDTNVEDLPQFSGAGLNLTIPHQRKLEDVLDGIKRVWASPFRERAYMWRKQILQEQGDVYPSVLLLASVPSEKSGVLITSGLQFGGRNDLTVVTAEGVGGVVEGEDAETILVDPKGQVRLLSQARAPYRQVLAESGSGGVRKIPSSKQDQLLQPAELEQLRGVVQEWNRLLAPNERSQIWDIEFGFVGGKLWLFQIRPFAQYRNSHLLAGLNAMDRAVRERGTSLVPLSE